MKVASLVTLMCVGSLHAAAQTSTCTEPFHEVFGTQAAYNFSSVAVVAPDDVWATGESQEAYFAHWDGESWSSFVGPSPPRSRNVMQAVSGTTTDDVWAVGQTDRGNDAVILHWDGVAWTVAEIPEVGRESILLDVVALDDGTALAVGAFRPGANRGIRPLIYRYDGVAWQREILRLERNHFGLSDVDGNEAGVWAVAAGRGFALQRTADVWSKVDLPRRNANMTDVAVTPEGSAWFLDVGGRFDRLPVVRKLDATGWHRYEIPNRRYHEVMTSIDARSDQDVWVGGFTIFGDHGYPYVARLSSVGTFEFFPSEERQAGIFYWDIQLDDTGGAWIGAEAGDAVVMRAC